MQKLKALIQVKAMAAVKEEGMDIQVIARNLREYAMKQCTFYKCNECKQAYFAGMLACAEAMAAESSLDPESLLCKDC